MPRDVFPHSVLYLLGLLVAIGALGLRLASA